MNPGIQSPARSIRVPFVGVLVSLAIAVAPASVSAATKVVTMEANAFRRAHVTVARGDRVRWVNPAFPDGVLSHDVMSSAPVGYVVSGPPAGVDPGERFTFTFRSAGRFAYVCSVHSGMDGTVTVPVAVTRLAGPVRFKVSVASADATGGWKHEIQVRRPGSAAWTAIRTTTAASVVFSPTRHGTYGFRSRVVQAAATSGWSPVVSRTY